MPAKIIRFDVELKSTAHMKRFDRPTVYTNDLNSVEIQFNILDLTSEELSTAEAVTMIYMRDGSFFQNPKEDVSRAGNVFNYVLKENEGNHKGVAKIQLVVTLPGTPNKEFASQLFEFEITNGLETMVAQEVMIHDWTTLTREAQEYLDLFEDIVLEEAQRVANENVRIANDAARTESLEILDSLIDQQSRNLLDPAGYTAGGYYSSAGVWTTSALMRSSNIIPVQPGEVLTSDTGSGQVMAVDKNGAYVAGVDLAGTFTVPPNFFITGIRVVVNTSPERANYVVRGSSLITEQNVVVGPFDAPLTPTEIANVTAETNSNLLRAEGSTVGGYYNYSGVWTASEAYKTSNFIEVDQGDVIAKDTGSGQYTYWGADKKFIGGANGVGTATEIEIPDNPKIRYIRTVQQISKGNAYVKKISAGTVTKYRLSEDFKVNPASLDYVETIPVDNLIDYDALEINKYYQYDTGAAVNSLIVTASALIPVKPGEQMFFDTGSGQRTFWDANGAYVSGLDVQGAFTVPSTSTITQMRANISAQALNDRTAIGVRGTEIPKEKYRLPSSRFVIGEQNELDYIKPLGRVNNPVITKAIVTDRTGVTGVADPFIVNDKGRYHMFFEVMTATTQEIGHAYSDNLSNWTYTGIVLPQAGYHRSAYPRVFKVDGTWYMTPDTGWQCNLYRATTFPSSWELVNQYLLPNTGAYVDTNIFKVKNTWYLTNTKDNGGVDLYRNTSGDFRTSDWVLEGTIIANTLDEHSRRCAGNPIVCDGYVLMPVQISADGVYGKYTRLYKLSNFGTADFRATDMGIFTKFQSDGTWNSRSMHHASHTDYLNGQFIYAVDGQLDGGEYSIGLYVGGADGLGAKLDAHELNIANPHAVTKTQVGLGNVDNTSDANKPISTATQTALNLKADKTTTDGINTRLTAEETATAANKISAVKGKTFADVDARIEELETQAITVDARTEFEATNLVSGGNVERIDTALGIWGGYKYYINAVNGNKYYVALEIKSDTPNAVRLQWSNSAVIGVLAEVNTYKRISGIITNDKPTGQTYVSATDTRSSGWTPTYTKNATVIDLTATFGAGKEPTLAEMDRLMARFPNSWFDGVKPVQTIETLYQEKANKVQESWITPTLQNGWTEASGYKVRYMKDEFGFIHLKGRLTGGTLSAAAFSLPVGYRPLETLFYPLISSGAFGAGFINSSGAVTPSVGSNVNVQLDGITFRAEA